MNWLGTFTFGFPLLSVSNEIECCLDCQSDLIGFVDFVLSSDVSFVVSETEKPVVVHQIVENITEFIVVVRTEESRTDLIDGLSQFSIACIESNKCLKKSNRT